jgi:sortase A
MRRDNLAVSFATVPTMAAGPGTQEDGEVTDVRVKKLVLVLAALALVVALAACGGPQKSANAPKAPQETTSQPSGGTTTAAAPTDVTLKLTVPKMSRVKDATIPYTTGDDEPALRDHAAIHLKGTGHPWQKEANVYIAGHRLGYPDTPSFLAFWDLNKVNKGDQVFLTDANGRKYTYVVSKQFEVGPTDLYVTKPVKGKNIVTLQSCTLPDYANRLLVQGELKS